MLQYIKLWVFSKAKCQAPRHIEELGAAVHQALVLLSALNRTSADNFVSQQHLTTHSIDLNSHNFCHGQCDHGCFHIISAAWTAASHPADLLQ